MGSLVLRARRPLSPSFAWIVWEGQGFKRFSLPAIGEAIELPSIDYQKFVSGS